VGEEEMIGTYNDLVGAAQGRKKELLEASPAYAPSSLSDAAKTQAYARYTGAEPTSPTRNMLTTSVSPADAYNPTSQYMGLMSSLGMEQDSNYGAGLSKKGKYGGFYTASDLESAIGGRAVETRSMLAQQLRGLAEQRYGQLTPMYQQARQSSIGRFVPGGETGALAQLYAGKSPGFVSQGFTLNKKSSDILASPQEEGYRKSLNEWFTSNLAPAEEALKTAAQVETTPLSDLARAIAVKQYGMNPGLARSKFADLDTREYERQRDAQYLQRYGVPYQQFEDIRKAEEEAVETEQAGYQRSQKLVEDAAVKAVEEATGFSASVLKNISGRTPEYLYSKFVDADPFEIEIPNPETGQMELMSTTPAQALQAGIRILEQGDSERTKSFVNQIAEKDADLARLIDAILAQNAKYKQDAQRSLMFAPTIFGQ
jgi:hypothetical protein